MRAVPADREWLTERLLSSGGAATKQFYLQRFPPTDGDDAVASSDPLSLSRHDEWALPTLLWAARLIACDERTFWECMGPNFRAVFAAEMDSWCEQQAVKIVHKFLEASRGAGDAGRTAALEAELAAYAAAHLRPSGDGVVAGSSKLRPVEGGVRGAVAVVPMSPDDAHSEGSLVCRGAVEAFGELLRVPRALMFFRGTVVEHCSLGRAIAADPALSSLLENEEALLVLCFLYEFHIVGAAQSHWRVLLESCPPSYPTVPAFWGFADLSELTGVDIVDEVIARRTQTAAFCADMLAATELLHAAIAATGADAVPTAEALAAAFTEDRVTFAKATFDSRAFNLRVDGADVLALVPWADMINHQSRTDVLVRRVEAGGGDFVMEVGAALTAPADVGRELWMSYGPLQNWELLQYYGFAIPDNAHDKLPFPFTGDGGGGDGVEWAERRAALVERYGLLSAGRCWVAHRGEPCEALCALMRVHMAQAAEFPLMEAEKGSGPFERLSAATERGVVEAIAATADAVLEQFLTTLEEDEALQAELDEEPADEDAHEADNLRLCLTVRMGIKQIARRLHQWSARALEDLPA